MASVSLSLHNSTIFNKWIAPEIPIVFPLLGVLAQRQTSKRFGGSERHVQGQDISMSEFKLIFDG